VLSFEFEANVEKYMKYFFAADGRRPRIKYGAGSSRTVFYNFIYSPVRAEYLIGGNVAGYQKGYSSVFVRSCPHLSSASGRQNISFDKTS